MTAAESVFALFASVVLVVGGLATLARAIWSAAQDLRDNKTATVANTTALRELRARIDSRLTAIEQRLSANEGRLTTLEHG